MILLYVDFTDAIGESSKQVAVFLNDRLIATSFYGEFNPSQVSTVAKNLRNSILGSDNSNEEPIVLQRLFLEKFSDKDCDLLKNIHAALMTQVYFYASAKIESSGG